MNSCSGGARLIGWLHGSWLDRGRARRVAARRDGAQGGEITCRFRLRRVFRVRRVPRPRPPWRPTATTRSHARGARRGLFVYSRLALRACSASSSSSRARGSFTTRRISRASSPACHVHATALALGSLGLPDAVYYFVGSRSWRCPLALARQDHVPARRDLAAGDRRDVGSAARSSPASISPPASPCRALTVACRAPGAAGDLIKLIATGRARLARDSMPP